MLVYANKRTQAVRQDKEEWLHEQASDLEYDLKNHNHFEFFRKLKNFDPFNLPQ